MFIAHCSHTPHPQLVLFNCPPLLYFRGLTLQRVLSNSPSCCDFLSNCHFGQFISIILNTDIQGSWGRVQKFCLNVYMMTTTLTTPMYWYTFVGRMNPKCAEVFLPWTGIGIFWNLFTSYQIYATWGLKLKVYHKVRVDINCGQKRGVRCRRWFLLALNTKSGSPDPDSTRSR